MMFKHLWPTTVMFDKFKDSNLLKELTDVIFANFDMANPPSDFGNYSIFDLDSEVMDRFRTEVVEKAFDDYLKQEFDYGIHNYPHRELKGWIAGYGTGYSMVEHNHSGAQLSAVFYILAEDKTSGGRIVFTDPRSNANRGYNDDMSVWFKPEVHQPDTGDIVVFPSFLYHHVTPYMSNLRVAIPVDLYLHSND